MYPDEQEHIRRHLFEGEQLLWAGQPRQGVYYHPDDSVLLLGLFLTVLMTYDFRMAEGGFAHRLPTLAELVMNSWIALPGLILCALVLTDWRLRARRAGHTFYAVTDRRAIVISGAKRPRVRSLDIGWVERARIQLKRGRWGTIAFRTDRLPGRIRRRKRLRFQSVQEPEQVLQIIGEAMASADSLNPSGGNVR